MCERKVFCEECRNDAKFIIKDVKKEGTIKGEKYAYSGKEAYCVDCNSEIYVAEVNDFNLKALQDEYRKRNNIVTLEVILAISEKYAIGKRPLSLLLGWGEQTFSRYCDGDMPTKQYSEILQKIYDDPQYYAKILEDNKENLKTLAAYEKSKKAVDHLLGKVDNTKTKIDLTIEYLLSQCEDITPLALQKALYYIIFRDFIMLFIKHFFFQKNVRLGFMGPFIVTYISDIEIINLIQSKYVLRWMDQILLHQKKQSLIV